MLGMVMVRRLDHLTEPPRDSKVAHWKARALRVKQTETIAVCAEKDEVKVQSRF